MPIRRQHRWLCPIDWRELSATIRFRRAKGRCEHCGRPHLQKVKHLSVVFGFQGSDFQARVLYKDTTSSISGVVSFKLYANGSESINTYSDTGAVLANRSYSSDPMSQEDMERAGE